jgi:putative transposase
MPHVGIIYVAYVNETYRRSGTLWEGRHKASLVDADNYLLICYRYIELNPVVANMVITPDQYRWSSYRYHAWGKTNALIKEHILYDALGSNQQTRQKLYRELFRHQIPEAGVHQIRQSLAYNYPLGDDRFQKQIESALGRRIGFKERGRPKINKHEE